MDWIFLASAILGIVAALVTIIYTPRHVKRKQNKHINKIVFEHLTHYSLREIELARDNYIQPCCQITNPVNGPSGQTMDNSREDLFKTIDKLLDNPVDNKYIILLGDTGTGKTSFVLNYYGRYLQDHKDYQLCVIPLGIKNPDGEIQKIKSEAKTALSETVLFLDALDEDYLAIVDHGDRIDELCEMTREFRAVLITCRTQFFPREKEVLREINISRLGIIALGKKVKYSFQRRYLSPFDNRQIKTFLRHKYLLLHWRKYSVAKKLIERYRELTIRPMVLAYIDDLYGSEHNFAYSFQLYDRIVEAWLDREVGKVEGIEDKEPLREFSGKLAVELYVRSHQAGGDQVLFEEIEALAHKFGIKLESWQLSGRSLLTRGKDYFRFAHRSIMEHLFVGRFISLPVNERPEVPWTDQMNRFLLEIIKHNDNIITFALDRIDVPGLAQAVGITCQKLNSDPRERIESQCKEMFEQHGFYDREKNSAGQGIQHFYLTLFRRRPKKVIYDLATSLTWQQSGSDKAMQFEEAQQYIEELNRKKYANYCDWRLPTLEEAMSLMEPKRNKKGLHIDPGFNQNQGYIWTADKPEDSSYPYPWVVYFGFGQCGFHLIGSSNYVRAVR